MTDLQRKILLDVMAAAAVKRVGPKLKNWDRMGVHLSTRLLSAPLSYNSESHTVEAVLSVGSPVVRPYGTEVLRISKDAVDLSRLKNGGIPLLDSHNQLGVTSSLGRVVSAWVSGGELRGRLKFHETDRGVEAEGMVERSEIGGISAGYRVLRWEITNKDGQILDPEMDRIRFDDDLTFTATKWELIECSLVLVPADPLAVVRHVDCAVPSRSPSIFAASDSVARAWMRQRMHDRAQAAAASQMRNRQASADALERALMRQRMHERQSAVMGL